MIYHQRNDFPPPPARPAVGKKTERQAIRTARGPNRDNGRSLERSEGHHERGELPRRQRLFVD